eukprot:NODE_819_length_761_cov_315.978933_g626_i0.p1 GENE.NODE_819_length_761_cov_315.978933_g626_i0~~NODE_819_length_761_cov_315.978933_g626_i0.p1  ORF type:complete len:140 (-),score=13.50 NODE_819_length_761_cov_315.978933_g626_i0:51-470(-)
MAACCSDVYPSIKKKVMSPQPLPIPCTLRYQRRVPGLGQGCGDLTFFLLAGYPSEQQAAMEPEILRHYLECLKKHGVKDYTEEDLRRDWALTIMYFPIYVCLWFGTTPEAELTDPTFPKRIISRTWEAMKRNNTVSYLE